MLENQKFDEYFVQVIKAQAKKCEFGELEDSLVKDMIGTRSNSAIERLFTEKDLELGKAVTICRSTKRTHDWQGAA
jgi:phosphoglycolate phosphatase-like HAD superfamily hydrolase